jgi:hypothetical protein
LVWTSASRRRLGQTYANLDSIKGDMGRRRLFSFPGVSAPSTAYLSSCLGQYELESSGPVGAQAPFPATLDRFFGKGGKTVSGRRFAASAGSSRNSVNALY